MKVVQYDQNVITLITGKEILGKFAHDKLHTLIRKALPPYPVVPSASSLKHILDDQWCVSFVRVPNMSTNICNLNKVLLQSVVI